MVSIAFPSKRRFQCRSPSRSWAPLLAPRHLYYPLCASQPQRLGILLDLVAPRARLGAVVRRALLPLRPEAGVEVPLQVAAHARRLVEEAARVAVLKGVDDVYAGCGGLVSEGRPGGTGRAVRRFSALSRWECMVGG